MKRIKFYIRIFADNKEGFTFKETNGYLCMEECSIHGYQGKWDITDLASGMSIASVKTLKDADKKITELLPAIKNARSKDLYSKRVKELNEYIERRNKYANINL